MEYNLRTVTKSCEKYKRLRFPLKIWILVNASGNRFLYWDVTETVVVVDREALEHYLASSGSIFSFGKLSTFFWLMDYHGFELEGGFGEDKIILQYKHTSFTRENRAYFEQLLRSQRQREVINAEKGNCSVHRTKIPRSLKQCEADTNGNGTAPSRLSSSSFAQEKFNLLMEIKSLDKSVREAYGSLAKSDDCDGMVPIIEVPDTYCDEPVASVPAYTKQRLIAGNYGRANLKDLKRFFGDYLPVYEDSPDTMETTCLEAPEAPTEETKEETVSEIVLSSSPEMESESLPVLLVEKPEPINTLETFDYQDKPNTMDNQDPVKSDVENYVPAVIRGEDLPLISFENGADEFGPMQDSANSVVANGQMDEAQFQLYSDIRETFELLNQF
ncbi:uncharacterized protein LOC110675377 [Aedes aegypti]|uniref:HSF-type DNA-binding domain-containing protein n=1 Tax=Aedes aegypti TaxID=7159 RepID=A0A6I8TY20_AEDAE|nr:uncharacterized protein LOC110675377 [Aedes aegypti]